VPLEIQRRVWGFEEFEAALSYVPIVDGEDDLFAGLGSPAEADALATSAGLAVVHDGRIPESAAPELALVPDESDARGGDSAETHTETHSETHTETHSEARAGSHDDTGEED
jgi:mycothiol S-conjugate amidase